MHVYEPQPFEMVMSSPASMISAGDRTQYENGRVVWKIVPYAHSSYSAHDRFATLQYFSNLDILDPSAGYINELDRILNVEAVYTGMTDDGLSGGSGAELLSGGGGNDRIVGYGGADTLLGGDGDDTLDGGYGSDVMAGGKGSDTASHVDVWQHVRIRLGAQLGETYGDDASLLEDDILPLV